MESNTNRRPLSDAVYRTAFDEDGALLAARTEAQSTYGDLTERDSEMLEVGVLAGAAIAVFRAEEPFEARDRILDHVDGALPALVEKRRHAVHYGGARGETDPLKDLRLAVAAMADRIPADSPWRPSLEVLQAELADGEPFFFRVSRESTKGAA